MKKLLVALILSSGVSAAELQIKFPDIVVHNDLSSSELATLSGVRLGYGQTMQGLFEKRIIASYTSDKLIVEIVDPVIYINKKHTPSSCEYIETLKHENEHVNNLKVSLGELESDLKNMPIQEAYNKFLESMDAKDKDTDSEEAYRNFFKAC